LIDGKLTANSYPAILNIYCVINYVIDLTQVNLFYYSLAMIIILNDEVIHI
jgi:hypothetical protein